MLDAPLCTVSDYSSASRVRLLSLPVWHGPSSLCPPLRAHVLENKGIAASTAFMYAACLQHHVPEVGQRGADVRMPAAVCPLALPAPLGTQPMPTTPVSIASQTFSPYWWCPLPAGC